MKSYIGLYLCLSYIKQRAVFVVVCSDTTYRIWRKAEWVGDDVERVFRLNPDTGHVVVREAGVYLVYAQVIDSLHSCNN